MFQRALTLGLLLSLIALMSLNAQEPTPQEVANTVSNYWIAQDFTNLNSYVTNLYTTYSNYFPAILAASFHDYVFSGKLADATNKLYRIQQVVNSNPSNFPTEFRTLMEELNSTLKWEIDLHSRKGRSPETIQSNASPQAVRSALGATLLPNIDILFYTPATNAP